MTKYHPTFERVAPLLVQDFIDEFKLTPEQACGYVGNFGHESSLISGQQEGKPLGTTASIRGHKGGVDWPQLTGDRRIQFAEFVEKNNLPYPSYKASWEFIKHELHGAFKGSLESVRKTNTIWAAVQTAGFTYEKFAGYEDMNSSNYKTRLGYAQRALDLWHAKQKAPPDVLTLESVHAHLVRLDARVKALEEAHEQ